MSSDLPRLSPPFTAAAPAEQLTTEGERERRLARRYRRLGWVFAIAAVLAVPHCIFSVRSVMFARQDAVLFISITILLLQAIVSPLLAVILFASAARHGRRAARCIQAAAPLVEGADLLAQAKSSRRTALRLGLLWPIVLIWSLLIGVGLLFLAVEGKWNLWLEAVGSPGWLLHRRIRTMRRRADLMEECARLGFGYREELLEALLAPFTQLPLFRRRGKATHLIQGDHGGRSVRIMDYGIATGEHTRREQTVAVVGRVSSWVAFRLCAALDACRLAEPAPR